MEKIWISVFKLVGRNTFRPPSSAFESPPWVALSFTPKNAGKVPP